MPWKKFQNSINVVGHGKNPKLMSVRPTFIPDYRIVTFLSYSL